MLIGARFETEKLGHTVEQISKRIRKVKLANRRKLVLLAAEEDGRTEIAGPVDAQDGCGFKAGGVIGRGGVRVMMLYDNYFGLGKTRPQLQLRSALRA